MTDDRPEPRYGQYAPLPPTPESPPTGPEPAAALPAVQAPRRTWDVVLTTLLLLLGVIDVVSGFPQFAGLAATLGTVYASQGFGTFTSDGLAATMGIAINVARVVVLAAAIVVSLLRIRANRIAFWVPLAGAALAALVVIVCVLAVILQDPALAEYVAKQSATP